MKSKGEMETWPLSQTVIQMTMERVSGDTLRDSALIPTYLSVISLAILIARVFWTNRKQEEGPADLKSHIKLHGGPVRFGLECLRFLLSIAILCLSFVTGARYHLDFAYIVLLSFIAVITSPKWNGIVVRHVNVLLVMTFLVYAYRDLFPLATYTLEPLDRDEGVLLWFKIGFLFTASALPLAMPRQYTPVNPEKPSANPSPEQTATLFSLIFFFFMDPVIFAASRVSHLPADQLPPLADYDAAEHLRERIREHIASFNPPDQSNPGHKKRHIFWILLKLVRYEYLGMTVMAMIHTLAKFVVPLALNQLLKFLEKDGEPGFVRPWFWVGMIFVGPNMSSMAIERYMFLALRALIHVDSILCQAIFSHALRIRMKADHEKKSKSSSSLIGKINNLVTTDVNNILEGPHLPFFFTYIPLQLAASLVFLYTILGWSAFVAFAVTLLFLPVPGYIASLTHRIQKEKMKRTDERVQMVTETTKVMRMVKLFGWEAKMSERIAEKRAEELKWIRKLRFVQVLAKVVK